MIGWMADPGKMCGCKGWNGKQAYTRIEIQVTSTSHRSRVLPDQHSRLGTN